MARCGPIQRPLPAPARVSLAEQTNLLQSRHGPSREANSRQFDSTAHEPQRSCPRQIARPAADLCKSTADASARELSPESGRPAAPPQVKSEFVCPRLSPVLVERRISAGKIYVAFEDGFGSAGSYVLDSLEFLWLRVKLHVVVAASTFDAKNFLNVPGASWFTLRLDGKHFVLVAGSDDTIAINPFNSLRVREVPNPNYPPSAAFENTFFTTFFSDPATIPTPAGRR